MIAGIKFAREKNIRLSIKNTGHDYVGRSVGKGSLALWPHNLKNISVLNYQSQNYSGPAIRIGAGVQLFELVEAAANKGLRVVGGYCPTIGVAGGYIQNGGYGPLASRYGLAADNTLEFEVITTDGQHTTASTSHNSDLYWALSGGGSGNYAVVISVTVKAHADGPVAGASFLFANTHSEAFWSAVKAWQEHLLVLNTIPGFSTISTISNTGFSLNTATFPGGTISDIKTALDPYFQKLEQLNLTLIRNFATINESYFDYFRTYTPTSPSSYPSNNTLGGRLVPRSTIEFNSEAVVNIFREILEDDTVPFQAINLGSNNVSYVRSGKNPGSNAVLRAWRDSLYTINFGIAFPNEASIPDMQRYQAKVNSWQDRFKPLTQGAYINEATFDNPDWKADYFGENYDKLLDVKRKYDPEFLLWEHTSVGTDVYWEVTRDGSLCRV